MHNHVGYYWALLHVFTSLSTLMFQLRFTLFLQKRREEGGVEARQLDPRSGIIVVKVTLILVGLTVTIKVIFYK